uniref:Glutamic acid-rich protein-like n=1 Tax=Tanacetum cinerariifolium TaxID=118510 RepID=A0A699HBY4_TANCI|nr:glutamic acid-rich protein-like [Tanacetum cinerariifolium]
MGYEKPSTRLTFYKAFFSPQWKFLIHTILQCMSAKRTSWNEFSSSMASAVICLSTGRKFNFSKYIFDSLVRNVDSSTKFNMVGKGFSRVDTPLFEGMIVPQHDDDVAASVVVDDVPAVADEPTIPSPTPTTQPPPPSQDLPSTLQDAKISMDLFHTLLETCTTLTRRVEQLEQDKIAQSLEITKLKQRVKKLERRNKLKVSKLRRLKRVGTAQRVDTFKDTVMDDVSKQGRIIASMDVDEDVTLKDVVDIAKEVAVDAWIKENADDDEIKPAKLQEVVEVVTTTKLRKGKKGVVIRDPEETATPSIIIHFEPKAKDKGKRIMVEEPKPLKKQAQIEQDRAYARELEAERKQQTEAQDRKNMMIYLRNMVGFKMDYFKGMSYDDIHPIFEKKFNFNVGFLQKIREQMEEEDSKALKRTREMPNDDDDVYTEATPLARKVPVVDYEIYTENNKPYYKIMRADESHQLFLSFLSLLRNFDREDLKKPDVQAQVWKNQRTVHGLAKVKSWRLLESCGVHIITFTTTHMILLVERRYPLTRFTLDQMLNNVRLEIEEDCEVSLELLRFVRQQQQEGFRPE